jgi:hypothetical protein
MQVVVLHHKARSYMPPKPLDAPNPRPIVLMLGPSAGLALLNELNRYRVNCPYGNGDWHEVMEVGDPIDLSIGKFVTFYALADGDPRTQRAGNQGLSGSGWQAPASQMAMGQASQAAPIGYGCFLEDTFLNMPAIIPAEQHDNIRRLVRPWDDILHFPSIAEQAAILADKFPPDVIAYAWRDHPEWIPDSVRRQAVGAVSGPAAVVPPVSGGPGASPYAATMPQMSGWGVEAAPAAVAPPAGLFGAPIAGAAQQPAVGTVAAPMPAPAIVQAPVPSQVPVPGTVGQQPQTAVPAAASWPVQQSQPAAAPIMPPPPVAPPQAMGWGVPQADVAAPVQPAVVAGLPTGDFPIAPTTGPATVPYVPPAAPTAGLATAPYVPAAEVAPAGLVPSAAVPNSPAMPMTPTPPTAGISQGAAALPPTEAVGVPAAASSGGLTRAQAALLAAQRAAGR